MDLIFLILGIVVASTYFTGIPCRVLLARHRQTGWSVAFGAPIIVGLLTVLLIFQGTLVSPREWLTPSYFLGTTPIGVYVLWTFVIAAGIGFVPAAFVVWFYRRRCRRDRTMA